MIRTRSQALERPRHTFELCRWIVNWGELDCVNTLAETLYNEQPTYSLERGSELLSNLDLLCFCLSRRWEVIKKVNLSLGDSRQDTNICMPDPCILTAVKSVKKTRYLRKIKSRFFHCLLLAFHVRVSMILLSVHS